MAKDHGAERSSLGVVWDALRRVHPLVICITNRVTPQRVADTLLATGASPVMADNPKEIGQMAAIANAIYVNTGMHETQIASLEAAAVAIASLEKPAVLDPVGVGSTEYRSEHVERLLAGTQFKVVRGNASEIRALAGIGTGTRGVDSSDSADSALEAARSLSRKHGCVVAVSGERDLVCDGARTACVGGGHPWLARMTGSGCALGALVAACVAASDDPWAGALAAHAAFALASERGAKHSAGPGTLSIHFLDELATLEPEDFDGAQLSFQHTEGEPAGEFV